MLHAATIGAGPRLVLVHGFTQTGRSWGRVADALAERHEVVLVDAPGHGGSSAVSADLWQGADLLAEVGGAAAYVGYSMGGRMALHLALAHPGLVERLVLVGATAGIEDEGDRAERRRADEALAERVVAEGVAAFVDRWLAGPLFASLSADAARRDERLANTAEGLADSLRRMGTGVQEDLWPRLGELAMPVLLVVGEHDAKFRAIAERMQSAIGPHAQVAVIDGAGHAAHLEQPDAFVAAVEPFLAPAPSRSLSFEPHPLRENGQRSGEGGRGEAHGGGH